MAKSITKRISSICPMCGEIEVVRHLPKEVDRQLTVVEVPASEEFETHKVSILRITYQRDYLCPNCKHQWSETHTTEKQQEA